MAEIKISELSIGDWVKTVDWYTRQDKCCVVEGIEKWRPDYVVVLKDEDGGIETLGRKCIEPIPLTPEILEKNGLEYEDDGNDAVIFLCCDMFWARLCVGDTFWQVGIHNEDRLDAVVCNVKHTHQLQHALRLAGVGKEIEV